MLLWYRSEEAQRLTSGGGLAGIDVADNDDVDMSLLLTADQKSVTRSKR